MRVPYVWEIKTGISELITFMPAFPFAFGIERSMTMKYARSSFQLQAERLL